MQQLQTRQQKSAQSNRQQQPDLNDSINRTTNSTSTDNGFWTKVIRFEKSDLSLLKRVKEISLTACLTQSERTKVCRGFRIRTGAQIIVKIMLVYKRHLKLYRMILGQAQLYYGRHKKQPIDYILQSDKITAVCNSTNAPAFKDPSQQQLYLQFTRPYLSGRSFHQQVYVHSKFPFGSDQLATYVKYVLDMLITDEHQPVFLPTMDNVYFNDAQIVGNLTSFETYMFLRKESQHLATENFKQLYILLPSDPKVFCQWEKMRDYMLETMKIKAFFVMLFCFATYRSPIEIVFGQKINQQDLQWPRLVDPKTGQIREENKIIIMIRDLPNRWKRFLDKPENRKCLQILNHKKYSQKENTTLDGKSFTYSQQEKNYMYNLMDQIFVKQKPMGWKDLFQNKYQPQLSSQKASTTQQYLTSLEPLRQFVIKSAKDQQMMKKQHESMQKLQELQKKMIKLPQEEYDTAPDDLEPEGQKKGMNDGSETKQVQVKLSMNRLDQREWKRLVSKVGFSYVHKYYMVMDIKKRKLDPQQATRFARSLHFQTYLPIKLSLPLNFTLDYQDWFEIFFEEVKDQRPAVYNAAKILETLIKQKSVDIMKSVKGCELPHLKRVEYILVRKLTQAKEETDELAELTQEMNDFATEVKLYDHMLQSGLNAIKNAQNVQETKVTKFQQLKMYQGEQYDDIRVILKTYLKIQETYAKSKNCLEWTQEQKKELKKYLKKVDDLKGPVKLRMPFRNILEQVQDVKKMENTISR